MMKILKKKIPPTLILSLIFIISFLAFSGGFLADFAASPVNVAKADSVRELTGWAWSDNVGWVSFNCENTASCGSSNYVVQLDLTSGNLSGYAWSDNLGWLSFNSSHISGCPVGSCQPRLQGNNFRGWARFLATDNNGYDGWVSLSCQNTNRCGTSNYGVTKSGQNIGGYAWGDYANNNVIGWINFDGKAGAGGRGVENGGNGVSLTQEDLPTVDLTANPAVVEEGYTSTLSWDTTNVDSCAASGGWSGSRAAAGSEVVTPVSPQTTYSLTCTGPEGSAGDSQTVDVVPSDDPSFSLSNSNNIYATPIAGPVLSNPTYITITPVNGFNSTVNFSEGLPVNGVEYVFNPSSLTYSEYNGGATVEFRARVYPEAGDGDITLMVRASGGGVIKETAVNLNVDNPQPIFEEF